jgi:hypothetical protein
LTVPGFLPEGLAVPAGEYFLEGFLAGNFTEYLLRERRKEEKGIPEKKFGIKDNWLI